MNTQESLFPLAVHAKKLKKHMPLLKIFHPEFEHGDGMWRLRPRLKRIFACGGPFSDSAPSAPAQSLHDI